MHTVLNASVSRTIALANRNLRFLGFKKTGLFSAGGLRPVIGTYTIPRDEITDWVSHESQAILSARGEDVRSLGWRNGELAG